MQDGSFVTGTLRMSQAGVPEAVQLMKKVLSVNSVPHGTGYYLREKDSQVAYCGWRDSSCAVHLSIAHTSHKVSTVCQKVKNPEGTQILDVDIPVIVQRYNKYMEE